MKTQKEIIKDQVSLLKEIKQELLEQFNIDFTRIEEIEFLEKATEAVYHEVNDWLLSDKISVEKQARMDAYHGKVPDQPAVPVPTELPSEKQKSFAKKLGILIDGKSKKEVTALIDEALAKEKMK